MVNLIRKKYEELVGFLVKKSDKKEIAKPNTPLSPKKKDDPSKPYLVNTNEEEIKKVEKFIKNYKDKIK